VKSFGWENRIAHPLPIQSWKSIPPCVVCAVKFGVSELILSDMMLSLVIAAGPGTWIAPYLRRTVRPIWVIAGSPSVSYLTSPKGLSQQLLIDRPKIDSDANPGTPKPPHLGLEQQPAKERVVSLLRLSMN